jgi:hypothetical protein
MFLLADSALVRGPTVLRLMVLRPQDALVS